MVTIRVPRPLRIEQDEQIAHYLGIGDGRGEHEYRSRGAHTDADLRDDRRIVAILHGQRNDMLTSW